MEEISVIAQKRLSMIEFYYQVKDGTLTSYLFKISRKTFYKWKNRYELSGSEFVKYFDEVCRRLNIIHIYLKVNT